MTTSLRFGCVPYLNAKPLIEGLGGVSLHPPALLAGLLEKGRFEIGRASCRERVS
jgi:hypothetical protein